MTIKVVAIKELLWSWHPIPKSWIIVPASDLNTINSADVLVQANIKENKKQRINPKRIKTNINNVLAIFEVSFFSSSMCFKKTLYFFIKF